ncbi:MAG: 50S ribosomal protein L15 [Lachnospiraceae bacterium]|nr:50S ribosomal protein L15 [Sarcina sp.]MEE1042056.1 50S ribosomal protein L15 [Lachnospiraceae bacterium]HAL58022.1 50S ribosomal protein L15 [Sarcina sp.]
MDLHNLKPAEGSKHDNYRRGRGHASGNGKTAGYGHKGQKARSGAPRPGFEGGQMPLYRRLPKRGFNNYNAKDIVAIDIKTLERFEDGAVVDEQTLLESGAVSRIGDGVKIVGNADLGKKLTVKVTAFSAAAKEKIEAAGGTAETIGR